MAIPVPNLSQTPPQGDQANAVVQGTLTAIGPTPPISFYGAFHLAIWGSQATTLTTTAGSSAATVASATGLSVGQAINSASVPIGTTIGVLSGTDVTLAFPAGTTNLQVLTGTAVAATFTTVAVAASVQLELTFDGGSTWIIAGVGGSGAQAVYLNPSSISIVPGEPEKQVAYRLNCTAYTSGTINYRMSGTGVLATSNGIPA